MSFHELTGAAMALPLEDRVALAQALWGSIDAGLPDIEEREAILDAVRRDRELSSGSVVAIPNEVAMNAARRAIGCE
ncbi:MAG: addiction module protein [Pirellulales bacterium]